VHSSAFESYIDGLIGDKTGWAAISGLTTGCTRRLPPRATRGPTSIGGMAGAGELGR
jgi:hypothetical protein